MIWWKINNSPEARQLTRSYWEIIAGKHNDALPVQRRPRADRRLSPDFVVGIRSASMTLDEDIDFWFEAANQDKQNPNMRLIAFGISAGLKLAKRDHANEIARLAGSSSLSSKDAS